MSWLIFDKPHVFYIFLLMFTNFVHYLVGIIISNKNLSGMTETETKIQSAIWELVTTEIDYIHALKTVTDVSMQMYFIFNDPLIR